MTARAKVEASTLSQSQEPAEKAKARAKAEKVKEEKARRAQASILGERDRDAAGFHHSMNIPQPSGLRGNSSRHSKLPLSSSRRRKHSDARLWPRETAMDDDAEQWIAIIGTRRTADRRRSSNDRLLDQEEHGYW